MKFSIEFGIEVATTYCTAYENQNVYIIMNFSALIVVNYIDLYYCNSIRDDLK